MLCVNVIKPPQSGWASPIVFAPEMDHYLGFIISYKKVNAKTLKDADPILQMHEA